ncbi:MAG: hypothetical protein ACKN92_01725 [Candidatus Nanopelagicaceae bacterium]
MRQRRFIAGLVATMMVFSISSAKGETPTREETVKILQQKYVTVLDQQHQTLLAIKVKMKSEPTLLKQVNAVLADFDSNYAAIIAGLNNPNQDLQPIKDLCEEEVEEFGNSIYQLEQMLKKLKTITCTKGKTTKQITGLTPKCPAGFTKKK